MTDIKKFLDSGGLIYFCKKFQNYPDNEILRTVINAIDSVKVDKADYAPIDKTDDMTIPVGVDADGKLYVGKDPEMDALKRQLAALEGLLKEI